MKEVELKDAKMGELVAFYNKHADKPVAKFADRKTAIRRCMSVLQSPKKRKEKKCPGCGDLYKGKPTKGFVDCDCGVRFCPQTGRVVSLDGLRSAAIAKSWEDPKTKAARSVRHFVRVGGVEYRSTPAAFKALKLPMNECIKFRMELKAAGKLKRYDKVWTAHEASV